MAQLTSLEESEKTLSKIFWITHNFFMIMIRALLSHVMAGRQSLVGTLQTAIEVCRYRIM